MNELYLIILIGNSSELAAERGINHSIHGLSGVLNGSSNISGNCRVINLTVEPLPYLAKHFPLLECIQLSV